MTLDRELRTALYSALNETITYASTPVKFFDSARDDAGENPHIFIRSMEFIYSGNKSTDNIRSGFLMLGVSYLEERKFEGKKKIDEVAESIETILETKLTLTNWEIVIQYLESTRYFEIVRGKQSEIIKGLRYRIVAQKTS